MREKVITFGEIQHYYGRNPPTNSSDSSTGFRTAELRFVPAAASHEFLDGIHRIRLSAARVEYRRVLYLPAREKPRHTQPAPLLHPEGRPVRLLPPNAHATRRPQRRFRGLLHRLRDRRHMRSAGPFGDLAVPLHQRPSLYLARRYDFPADAQILPHVQ